MKPALVERKRLLDAGWMEALPLALNFISLAANGFIIRTLGETGYGSLVIALGLSGTTAILSNLGIRSLYTKAIAGADNSQLSGLVREQLGLRFFLALFASVLAVAAAVLLYPNDHIVIGCTAIQALGLLGTISWTVLADVLNSRELFRRNATIAFVAGLWLTGFAVAAAALGLGPLGVATAYLLGPLVNLVMQYRAVTSLGVVVGVGGVPFSRYAVMLREARALAANDIVRSMIGRAEAVWAPLLLGKATIGTIAAGSLPTDRLGQISDGVATAYFPAMAGAHNRGEDLAAKRQAIGMFTLMLAIAIPLALFAFIAAPYFSVLVFPASAQEEVRSLCTFVTRISAIVIPVTTLNSGIRYAVQSFGKHSANAKQQIIASVFGAGAALGMALAFGAKGLVVAVLVKSIIMLAFQGRLFIEVFGPLYTTLPWTLLAGMWVPLGSAVLLTVGISGTRPLWFALVCCSIAAGGYAYSAFRLGLIERPAKLTEATNK